MSAAALHLALGKFDSLHLGHRALLVRAAAAGRPAIVRFTGMAETLGWQRREPLLAAGQFEAVLGEWARVTGREIAVLDLDFPAVRGLEPAAFLRLLREDLDVAGVVVGDDFRFGRDRAGDVALLHRLAPALGLQVQVEPPVVFKGQVLSTTLLRQRIAEGDVVSARAMLGRPYRLCGRVVAGAGRGRRLGFPTANCGEVEQLLPLAGVYAARVGLGGEPAQRPAALNIGWLPTLTDGAQQTVEAHLLDWQGDCYGQAIEVDLYRRIRGEQRFAGAVGLVAQISADVAAIRAELLRLD
jgi:riboflavin kinase/FMN adenylyltransferase